MCEIGRIKLFLYKEINIVHEVFCTRNTVCVHVKCIVVTVHAVCEDLAELI